jgi:hypothetical protein
MFLRSALVTIFVLPALISGSQIPTVNGVIGGVSSGDAHNSSYKNLAGSGSGDPKAACTPGKLRGVVENSCICGGVLLFNTHALSYSQFWQKKKVSIRLLDMVTLVRARASGLYLTVGPLCFFISSVFDQQVLVLCRAS